ncbi:MAG: thioesterase family protein [Bacteroidales bacterium]
METHLGPGVKGKKEILVTADKLATAFGSGTVDVFATPAMIALMEQTAMESVSGFLPEGFVSVGTEVSIKHFKATLAGKKVVCTSKLLSIDDRKLVFEVVANDETGTIGKGQHTRFIIDKQLFINNLKDK